jgi:hypothetical protein
MPSNTASGAATSTKYEFKPVKEHIDLDSVKVQMVCGSLLIFAVCLAAYWPSLKVGFLLDDFLHVDYVAKALSGQWGAFLSNFTGNWAGSDLMRSYRPAASLSVFLDYLLWGTNAAGFHLTNILLLCGSSVFVSLITLELTGGAGNRLGAAAAIWAGLLFAIQPLHPEAVAWIIGRVDLLCTLFFLASVFCYLRFRLLSEPGYLTISIACFLTALLSKEMAVTLPAVITLAELCLPRTTASVPGNRSQASLSPFNGILDRLKPALLFWLVLAAYALVRTLILGTVVGGYGQGGLVEMVKSWRVFLDRPTLWKLVFPANEEYATADLVRRLLPGLLASAGVFATLRIGLRSAKPGPFLLLAGWAIVSILPTFQIWHIYPNLVGSRLFFLSSAPFCMLIALAVFPSVDVLAKRKAVFASFVSASIAMAIFLSWGALLKVNLQPWIAAGQTMSALRNQLVGIASGAAPGKRALLLDLPTDISGAGLLTRSQYLELASKPPFARPDLSGALFAIEPPVAGSHDFMWPRQFEKILQNPNCAGVYEWSPSKRSFVPWHDAGGAPGFSFSAAGGEFTVEPAETPVAASSPIVIFDKPAAFVEKHRDCLRIYPGPKPVTVWLPVTKLDPRKGSIVNIDMEAKKGTGCTTCFIGKVKLVWQTANPRTPGELHEAIVVDGRSRNYVVDAGRIRGWTLSGPVTRLGLELLPGDVSVNFYGLSVTDDSATIPRLDIQRAGTGDPRDCWIYELKAGQPLALRYDAAKLAGSTAVRLLVTEDGSTFDANTSREIGFPYPPAGDPGKLFEEVAQGAAGTIAVPQEAISKPGLHQLRIQALDRAGLTLGLPSEPLSVLVP